MELPVISETKKDKEEADGGGMVQTLFRLLVAGQVVGQPGLALKLFSFMDSLFTINYVISNILAISSCWRFISESPEPPLCWREVLSQAWTSGVVTNSTGTYWFCEEDLGRDLYLALGIHLLVLIFYLHRSKVSFCLLYTFFMDVSISLRVKYCRAWMINSMFFVLIYYLAFLISQDISKLDVVELITHALRLSSFLFCLQYFYSSIQNIQREEQEFP